MNLSVGHHVRGPPADGCVARRDRLLDDLVAVAAILVVAGIAGVGYRSSLLIPHSGGVDVEGVGGKGVDLATQAGSSITEIRDGALRVVQVVNSISDAIREQGAASSEIAKNVEHIALMSEESATAVEETASAARHLQQLSSSLSVSVSRFRLS